MIWATGIIFRRWSRFYISMMWIVCMGRKKFNLTKKSMEYWNEKKPIQVYIDTNYWQEQNCFEQSIVYYNSRKPIKEKECDELFELPYLQLVNVISSDFASNNFVWDWYVLIDEHWKEITSNRDEIIIQILAIERLYMRF